MMSIDEVVSNTRKPHQAKQEDYRRKSGLVNKRGPGVRQIIQFHAGLVISDDLCYYELLPLLCAIIVVM